MAEQDNEGLRPVKVFISYSRKDKAFVRQLHNHLVEHGLETWVDWEAIPLGTDWWEEIVEGIQSSDNFLFVISPDSVTSEVCAEEIRVAIENNKRLIPVLHREEKGTVGLVHPSLQAINFTFMKSDEEFEQVLPDLVDLLQTDLDYVKNHTRLQNLALEWEKKGRSSSLTLRAENLDQAEYWLTHAAGKEPIPSVLQVDYIEASRHEANRRQRLFLGAVSVALVVMLFLTVLSVIGFRDASNQERIAQENAKLAINQRETAVANQNIAATQRSVAQTAEAVALEQREIAETNELEANNQRSIAEAAQVVAQEARKVAEEQRDIAESGQLAAAAEAFIPRGNLLTRSILLSIKSLDSFLNAKADEILRRGLDLLPMTSQVIEQPAPGKMVAYTPNGDRLVTALENGVVVFTDPDSGETLQEFDHGAPVQDMLFARGIYLVTAGDNGLARIWDIDTGELVSDLDAESPILDLAVSLDGLWLATASEDELVRVWTMSTFRPITYMRHNSPVTRVTFSPGGTLVASGSSDGDVRVWKTISGEVQFTLPHDTSITTLEFNSPLFRLVSGESGGAIHVWNLESGGEMVQMSQAGAVNDLVISQDGKWLASASSDQTAHLWDVDSGLALHTFEHDGPVLSVAFNADSSLLVSSSQDSTSRVWDTGSGLEIARFEHDAAVRDAVFSPDGRLIASTGADGTLRTWNHAEVGQAVSILKTGASITQLAYNPANNLLAGATTANEIRIWDLNTNQELGQARVLPSRINNLAFSPDGQLIATGTQDGQACIWTVADGSQANCFEAGGPVWDVAFNPDGTWLAVGSGDGSTSIFNVADGERLNNYRSESAVRDISLHPDGDQLAVASLDGKLWIWNLQSNDPVVYTHPAGVTLVKFVPGHDLLVSVATDNIVRFWNTETGLVTRKFIFDDPVRSIDIDPGRNILAVATAEKMVHFQNFETGEEVARVEHLDKVTALVILGEDGLVATVGEDQRILISLLDPDALIAKACNRLTRNFTNDEWGQFIGQEELYTPVCGNLPVGEDVLLATYSLAGTLGAEGKSADAEALLSHLLEISPDLAFDPAEKVTELTVESIISSALADTEDNDVESALEQYARLQDEFSPDISDGYLALLRSLCLIGPSSGFSADVLAICDQAIDLDPDSSALYDSRGRARADVGNLVGAADDFRLAATIRPTEPIPEGFDLEVYLENHENWIATLNSGANPFETP
jgi:WD40 repeat protein